MKQNVFAIYDSKANAYLSPFFLPTVGMAVRVFSDCVNSKDHQFGAHPADYTLFHLGIFDDATCEFAKLDQRRALHNGVEVLRSPEDPSPEDPPALEQVSAGGTA